MTHTFNFRAETGDYMQNVSISYQVIIDIDLTLYMYSVAKSSIPKGYTR